MRTFNILRYMKKFGIFIPLLGLLGALAVYSYADSNQQYTASIVIKYTNKGISSGYTPTGTALDTSEIYLSTVIASAIDDLGLNATIDSIRSKCYVNEVVSSDQQTINEVLLEKGEESTYFPDTYKVFFVADSSKSADYARDVLDAIIKNYCSYYTDKYVQQRLLPNVTIELSDKEYDLIESLNVLEDATAELFGFVTDRKASYGNFRSSLTGYSYSDFYDIYEYLYDYQIPTLYAMILSDAESRDIEVLVKRMTNEIEEYDLAIENLEVQIEKLLYLIENYSDRNKEMMDYHFQDQMTDSGTDYILKDVDGNNATDNETTYDGLLQKYVSLRIECEEKRINKEHDEYLLSVFSELLTNERKGTHTTEEIQKAIDEYADTLNTYYDILDTTGEELNSYLSADYLQMVSTISVSTAINTSLYIKLAIVLFVVVGCGGAVVLGRAMDFIEYFLYIDKLVKLPNRACCDLYINDMAKKLLPENYTCVYMTFDSLVELSQKYGRTVGDEVMGDFAAIIKSFDKVYDFAGYNGSGEFVAFFTNCPPQKAEVIMTTFRNQVNEYNNINQGHDIAYTSSYKTSSSEGIYEIRELLRASIGGVKKQKASKVEPKSRR